MIRLAVGGAIIALVSVSCGSGANASQGQGASALEQLRGALAKQVFAGTIVVKDTASLTLNTSDTIGRSRTTRSLNRDVSLAVTAGGTVATIAYAEKSRVDSELTYQYHKVVGYKTEETRASGTNRDNSSVSVDLRSDGSYQIAFRGGGVQGEYRMVEASELICTDLAADPTCRPGTTSSNDNGKPPSQGGVSGSVDGKLDRKQPNVLAGSVTQPLDLNDGSVGNRTITWNLSR
jgi:hypothetical protein